MCLKLPLIRQEAQMLTKLILKYVHTYVATSKNYKSANFNEHILTKLETEVELHTMCHIQAQLIVRF